MGKSNERENVRRQLTIDHRRLTIVNRQLSIVGHSRLTAYNHTVIHPPVFASSSNQYL